VKPPEEGKEPVKKGITLDSKYLRVSPSAFHAMLKFFYYSDSAISLLNATVLVDFAKDFHLERLYKILEKVIGGQDIGIETVLSVLDVAYNPLMEENPSLQKNLKEEGLNYAVNNLEKINFNPLQAMPPIIATHIIQAIQSRIGKNWKAILEANPDQQVKGESLKTIASAPGPSSNSGANSANPNWPKTSPRKDSTSKPAPESSKDGGAAIAKSPSKATVTVTDGSKDAKKDDKKDDKAKKDDKKDDKKKEDDKKGHQSEADKKVERSKSSASKKHDDKEAVSTPKGKQ